MNILGKNRIHPLVYHQLPLRNVNFSGILHFCTHTHPFELASKHVDVDMFYFCVDLCKQPKVGVLAITVVLQLKRRGFYPTKHEDVQQELRGFKTGSHNSEVLSALSKKGSVLRSHQKR